MNGSQFPYEDIVNLPHHVSRNRPQMPLRDYRPDRRSLEMKLTEIYKQITKSKDKDCIK